MDYGQQLRQANEHALQNFYQPTGNRFERVERKSLIIDSKGTALDGTNITFDLKLQEPLKIDKLSDVYLDSFTTFNCVTSAATGSVVVDSGNMSAFLLSINELNINSNSGAKESQKAKTSTENTANNVLFNKIYIPNAQSATDSGDKLKIAVTHKNKKFNYICSINPTTLSQISGTLTDLSGVTGIMIDSLAGRFIAELVFISRGD